MIKQKKKNCINCNTEQYIFSRKRCKRCASIEDHKPIKKQTTKNKVYKKERGDRRAVYFEHHIILCSKSENSGQAIPDANRANICHILDKGRHPSVEDLFINCIYLTLEEHTNFDNWLFKHEFDKIEQEMPVAWKIVLGRLEKIIPKTKENTKLKMALQEILSEI